MKPANLALTEAGLVGVWKRTELRLKGVPQPDDQEVYWVQVIGGFGDIRVAKAPIDLARGAAATAAQARQIAAQDAFAGTISLDGAVCRWHREIDYHPDAPPDAATFHLIGDDLHETGLGPPGTDGDYYELFRRQSKPTSRGSVFRSRARDGLPQVICIMLDETVYAACSNAEPVPPTHDDDPMVTIGCDAVLAQSGQIVLATHPWRRGQPLETCLRRISENVLTFEDRDETIMLHADVDRGAGTRRQLSEHGAVE